MPFKRIERWGLLTQGIQVIFQGVSLGSILLLMALGLAIIFGLMGVINMAHGELMALGAYTTYVTQGWFQGNAPGAFEYYFHRVAAALLSRRGRGRASSSSGASSASSTAVRSRRCLLTWGISLMIQQGLRLWFRRGERGRHLAQVLSGGVPVMVGFQLPLQTGSSSSAWPPSPWRECTCCCSRDRCGAADSRG